MKIGIIQTAIAIIFGMVAMKLIDHVSSLKIPSGENIQFSRTEGDKQIPILNLAPNGVLSLNIPALMKEYEKSQAAEKAKTSPAPHK